MTGTPSFVQTCCVTSSLSPVTIFTATPLATSAASAFAALALGGSRNAAKPANTSSVSSLTTAWSWSLPTCFEGDAEHAQALRAQCLQLPLRLLARGGVPRARRSGLARFVVRRQLENVLRRAFHHQHARGAVVDQHRDASPLEIEGRLVDLLPPAHVEMLMREDRLVERALEPGLEVAVQIGKLQHTLAVAAHRCRHGARG